MRIEESKHEQGEDLQHQPAVERDPHPGPCRDPSTEEICNNPKELVEQEEERDRNTVVAKFVEVQNHKHPQRAVSDREAPVGSRYQRVATDVVHRELSSSRTRAHWQLRRHFSRELDHSIHVAPFVVVPSKNLYLGSVNDHCG